jgi:hypothetical protein
MPSKRETLNRPRRPRFTSEALALFAKLEAVPEPRRDKAWQGESRLLSALLGLENEWFCSGCDVLDRSTEPCHSPEYVAHHAWFRVRAVREALLDAIATERASLPPCEPPSDAKWSRRYRPGPSGAN